jgi:hypothetical protein
MYMEQSTQTEVSDLAKDIYAKLDTIHAVLGLLLEKNKMLEPNDLHIPKDDACENLSGVKTE